MRSYTIISSIVAVCGKFPGTDSLIERIGKRGRIEEFGRDDVPEPVGSGDLMADFGDYLDDPENQIARNRFAVSKKRYWMKPDSESIPRVVAAFILECINLGIPLRKVVARIPEEYQGLAMFDVPALVEMSNDVIFDELLDEMIKPDFFGHVADEDSFEDLFEMGIEESLSSGSLDDMGESKAFDMGALYPSPLGVAEYRPSPTFSVGSNAKPVKSHSAKPGQKQRNATRKATRKAGGNGVI